MTPKQIHFEQQLIKKFLRKQRHAIEPNGIKAK
jgi:hypothetical protein